MKEELRRMAIRAGRLGRPAIDLLPNRDAELGVATLCRWALRTGELKAGHPETWEALEALPLWKPENALMMFLPVGLDDLEESERQIEEASLARQLKATSPKEAARLLLENLEDRLLQIVPSLRPNPYA
jgi:hypothetical protein